MIEPEKLNLQELARRGAANNASDIYRQFDQTQPAAFSDEDAAKLKLANDLGTKKFLENQDGQNDPFAPDISGLLMQQEASPAAIAAAEPAVLEANAPEVARDGVVQPEPEVTSPIENQRVEQVPPSIKQVITAAFVPEAATNMAEVKLTPEQVSEQVAGIFSQIWELEKSRLQQLAQADQAQGMRAVFSTLNQASEIHRQRQPLVDQLELLVQHYPAEVGQLMVDGAIEMIVSSKEGNTIAEIIWRKDQGIQIVYPDQPQADEPVTKTAIAPAEHPQAQPDVLTPPTDLVAELVASPEFQNELNAVLAADMLRSEFDISTHARQPKFFEFVAKYPALVEKLKAESVIEIPFAAQNVAPVIIRVRGEVRQEVTRGGRTPVLEGVKVVNILPQKKQ